MAPSLYSGQQSARTLQQAEKAQAKADKKRIRQLEQELRRKDKALAGGSSSADIAKARCLLEQRRRGQLTCCQSGSNTLHGGAKRLRKLAPASILRPRCWAESAHAQRWLAGPELSADRRPMRSVPIPARIEPRGAAGRADVCNSQEFGSCCRRVKLQPRLADQGATWPVSRASIASCGRLTSSTGVAGVVPPRHVPVPTSHTATGPNQAWSWDITYLPSLVRGQYYYLYLIEGHLQPQRGAGSA